MSVASLKGVSGSSNCNIWIADKAGDGKPTIMDFVTGCSSIAAAKKYLTIDDGWNNATGHYAIFDWNTGKWVDHKGESQ